MGVLTCINQGQCLIVANFRPHVLINFYQISFHSTLFINVKKIRFFSKSNLVSLLDGCFIFESFFVLESFHFVSHQEDSFNIIISNKFSQGPLLFLITDIFFNEFKEFLFSSDVISPIHSHSFYQPSFQKIWQFACNLLQIEHA